jgi:hypothetical protein
MNGDPNYFETPSQIAKADIRTCGAATGKVYRGSLYLGFAGALDKVIGLYVGAHRFKRLVTTETIPADTVSFIPGLEHDDVRIGDTD